MRDAEKLLSPLRDANKGALSINKSKGLASWIVLQYNSECIALSSMDSLKFGEERSAAAEFRQVPVDDRSFDACEVRASMR